MEKEGFTIMYNQILNMKDNVVMVGDMDNDNVAALVNGKLYNCYDYRPLDGDGRQLREDNQRIIKQLFNEACEIMVNLKKAERYKLKEVEKAVEQSKAPENPAKEDFINALFAGIANISAEKVIKTILPDVEKAIVEKFGPIPVIHQIKVPEKPEWETTEVLHKDFDKICQMVIDGEPVYLCGPAGTGKSYLCQQVAKALNLEFYYSNAILDDVGIKGFVDAMGNYHETQFYQAFTNGGIFLLDELDASIPEVLNLLNNALANGYFDFPGIGRTMAHADFHCMAAGNTYGTGADNVYTGRYQLDAATMDRFSMVIVDYDRAIEMNMAQNDVELVEFAENFRKAITKTGVTCLCTYRAIKRLAKFSHYMEKSDALRMGLLKGLSMDDCRLIYKNLEISNSWENAMAKLFN